MIFNEYDTVLMLSSGDYFLGHKIGVSGTVTGECCFSTSMTGYQESVTDPSYIAQILLFTFPHIGNVGFNKQDYESKKISVQGVITREPISIDSNYRSEGSFNEWLINNNIVGICGVDTRAITKQIVDKGNDKCIIAPYDAKTNLDALYKQLQSSQMLSCENISHVATCDKYFDWNEPLWNTQTQPRNNLRVAVIDFGVKLNILRCLYSLGCDVRVFPFHNSVEDIMDYKPNGILLSNGPGNPLKFFPLFSNKLRFFLEKKIPLFGICFGHQLLALALNGSVYRMHYGHRSITHPVFNKTKNHVYITTQNHGFAVDKDSLGSDMQIIHESLLDGCVEAIKATKYKAFSVQYHPECCPGPNDSKYLFEDFISMMKN